MNVRLVGGPFLTEGRLEVEIGGSWGSVCDSGTTGRRFNHAAAQVVCRKLGFPGGWARWGTRAVLTAFALRSSISLCWHVCGRLASLCCPTCPPPPQVRRPLRPLPAAHFHVQRDVHGQGG